MKCLIVLAHPLQNSLCAHLAQRAERVLRESGHEVEVEDLYARHFAPALTVRERATYYAPAYDASALEAQIARLQSAQGLVMVFPAWWFGPPAILKGWFDRVWAPGFAYEHASDLGAIRPRLVNLRRALVINSMGAPKWIDWFVMWRPVHRILKWAIFRACAPRCGFESLTLHKAEHVDERRLAAFCAKIESRLRHWR